MNVSSGINTKSFHVIRFVSKGRQENTGELGELKAEIQVTFLQLGLIFLDRYHVLPFLPVSEGIAPEQSVLPSATPCVSSPLSSCLAVEAE